MRGILEIAQELIEAHTLCDNCLGRQFADLATGTSNAERGRSLKNTLAMKAHIMITEGKKEGRDLLKRLCSNGFSDVAREDSSSLKT
jgi:tRNA pseudouridine synthase 10